MPVPAGDTGSICVWDLVSCTPSDESASACPHLDNLDEITRDIVVGAAVGYLWNVTGRKYGTCPTSVRPCEDDCGGSRRYLGWGWAGVSGLGWVGSWSLLRPMIWNGEWINLACGTCADRCECGRGISSLRLPGPVAEILEVRIDGAVLPETDYRLDNTGLVRLGGERWPTCFPAGTLVTTRAGQVPIERVLVGSEVLTHEGRWRRVLDSRRTGVRRLVTAQARGPLTATADHLVWARTMERQGNSRKFSEPTWQPLGASVGMYAAHAKNVPDQTPPLPEGYAEVGVPEFFWNLVGFWLGDGCITENNRIKISVQKQRKIDYLDQVLAGWGWNRGVRASGRRVIDYRVTDHALAPWLTEQFGAGAREKRLPAWLLGAPREVREAFLDGLVNSDGCTTKDGEWRITTTSKQVAIGVKILLATLGIPGAAYRHRTGHWQVNWRPGPPVKPQSLTDDLAVWVRVRAVGEETELEVPVYDLTVEEDHSFVADGVIVHNCQNMSGDPLTDPDTFMVSYMRGRPAPPGGQLAAGTLACELAKMVCGDKTCRLPKRVTSINREGVTIDMIDSFSQMWKMGSTGLLVVDMWIASERIGQRGSTQIASPDRRPYRNGPLS